MERQGRPDPDRDAALVAAVREGRRDAFAPLVEEWFDRCWEVSWRILHDRERAAEVTQDVMLAAWQKLDTLSNPGSFGGWVLRMSRNRSLDRLAHEQRMLPTDDEWMLEPRDPGTALGDPEQEAIRQEAHDLVWAAAAALGERDASILDLHLRHGLEARELAGELGIEPNAANQALHRMRGRLGNAIRARMLWRNGDPQCDALADALTAAKIKAFGPPLVRLIDRHVKDCDACAQRQRAAGSAVALFAAVPFVAASPMLRATSAQALAAQGVPVPTEWTAEAAAVGVDHTATDAASGAATPETTPITAATQGPDDTQTAMIAAPSERRVSRRTLTVLAIVLGALLLAGGAVVVAVALTPTPVPIETTSPTPSATPSATSRPTPSPTPTPTPTPTPSPTPPPPPPPPPPPSEPEPVVPAPTAELSAFWVGVSGCPPETPFLYRIRWSTTDAEQAVLSGTWGSDGVAPAGEAERCGEQTSQFTLTATGPGGQVVEVVEAQAVPQG